MVGRRVAHYEVVERLGAGGMGEVFRARDRRLGRDVAIKFLPAGVASNQSRLARFEQEARSASSLSHPNIVTIHEVGRTEEGAPFIVMELVKGRTLRQILVPGKPLVTRRALELAAQAAEGLAKAHAAGIVHRDLKPENLMVTDDGFVKILDFGLVKLTTPAGPESGTDTPERLDLADTESEIRFHSPKTHAGTVLGTVGYMSPEQARGLAVDFRSDQFSCGAILYEMATGRRAFEADSGVITMARIIESEPEAIQALNPACPAPFRWIIDRCLKKDPEERYASTLDLARELRTVCDRLDETASGASGPVAASSPRLRPWVGAALAVTAMVALASGALLRPLQEWVERQPVPKDKHLAILPFATGTDESSRVFSDGLVESLASKLTQLDPHQGSLWVVPMSDVRQANVTSAAGARRAFGATLVVTGSLQRSGSRIRLTANLVDAITLRQLRAMVPLEAAASDLTLLQDQVVGSVARMLELEVDGRVRQALAAGGTRVSGAYELYLEGRGHLARYEAVENVDRAIRSFQQALQHDQTFALAYAGLGEAYWRQYELERRPGSVELAQKACRRALELNDLLAPVHVTLGLVRLGTGKADAALEDFGRALALDPGSADALQGMAAAQSEAGRFTEAEATYRRAIALRPDYWGTHNDLGRFYYRRGRYPDAEAEFRKVVDLVPDNARGLSNLGGVFHLMGRFDEALVMLKRSTAIRPTYAAVSNIATLEFYLGRYAESARSLERAVQLDGGSYEIWYNLAAAYYWAPGERDRSRAAYERAVELGEKARRTNPRDAPLLATLADSYAHLGQSVLARKLAGDAVRLAPAEGEVLFQAAGVFEYLGERERALGLVRRALDSGYSAEEISRAPNMAGLRADPRFAGRG